MKAFGLDERFAANLNMLLTHLIGWAILAPPPDLVVRPARGGEASSVELDGAHALALREAASGPAPTSLAHASRRDIKVSAHAEGLLFEISWNVHGYGSMALDGMNSQVPIQLVRDTAGLRLLGAWLTRASSRTGSARPVASSARKGGDVAVLHVNGWLALDPIVLGRDVRGAPQAGTERTPGSDGRSPRGTSGDSTSSAALLPRELGRPSVDAALGTAQILTLKLLLPLEPGASASPSLELLAATRGTIRIDSALPWELNPERSSGARSPKVGDTWWTSDDSLTLRPSSGAAERGEIVLASVGQGVSLAEGEARYRARIHLENRLGARDDFTIRLPAVGEDLQIAPNPAFEVTRQGDTLTVHRTFAAANAFDVELAWTSSVIGDKPLNVALPTVDDVWKSETSLQVSRDSDIEGAVLCGSCRLIAGRELPKWGKDLTSGSVIASYREVSQATIEVVPFVALEEPPVFVDVAEYDAALSKEGRLILSIRYEVRNDRASGLTLSMPRGYRLLGVRVAGDTARLTQIDSRTYRVPLPRSIESIEGLLTFPVEVSAIATGREAWSRREEHPLLVPTIDAPIAVARATMYLPRGYRARAAKANDGRVSRFSRGEGIAYGFARGDQRSALADQLYREAVKGYQSNDFTAVQTKLDELKELGASNENLARLQGNVDVIEGRFDSSIVDTRKQAAANRVRAIAKAKGKDAELEQERQLESAREAERSGDLAKAEESYSQALVLGGKLAQLEDTKNLDKDLDNRDLEKRVQELQTQRKKVGAARTDPPARSSRGALNGRSFAQQDRDREPGFAPTPDEPDQGGQAQARSAPALVAAQGNRAPSPLPATPPPSTIPTSSTIPIPSTPYLIRLTATDSPAQAFGSPEPISETDALQEVPTSEQIDVTRTSQEVVDLKATTVRDFSGGFSLGGTTSESGRRSGRKSAALRRRHSTKWGAGSSTSPRPSAPTGGVVAERNQGFRSASPPQENEDVASANSVETYTLDGANLDEASELKSESDSSRTENVSSGDSSPVEEEKARDLAREPLSVTASGLSVTVPATGEAVLYQRLLLATGEQPALLIRAQKRSRRAKHTDHE